MRQSHRPGEPLEPTVPMPQNFERSSDVPPFDRRQFVDVVVRLGPRRPQPHLSLPQDRHGRYRAPLGPSSGSEISNPATTQQNSQTACASSQRRVQERAAGGALSATDCPASVVGSASCRSPIVTHLLLKLRLGGRRKSSFADVVPKESAVAVPVTAPGLVTLGRTALVHVRVLALVEWAGRLLNHES